MQKKESLAIGLAEQIKIIIANARKKVATAIKNESIVAYWQVGEIISTKERHSNLDTTSSRKIILELSKI